MDIFAIANALRRHLAVTAIIGVLTAAALVQIVLLIPRDYESQASYVLVNPVAAPTDAEIEANPSLAQVNRNNPYLRFSNQATVGQVLSGRVGGDAVRDALVAQGADRDYTIAPSADYGGSGQVIDIVGTGTSPEQAQETLQLVQGAMTEQLEQMQTVYGASPDSLITVLPVAEPTGARVVLSGLIRTIVGVVGAGVVVLFAAISVAEARRSRRSAAAGEPPSAPATAGRAAPEQMDGSTPQVEVLPAKDVEDHPVDRAQPVSAPSAEESDRSAGLSLVTPGERTDGSAARSTPSRGQGLEAQRGADSSNGWSRNGKSGASRRLT